MCCDLTQRAVIICHYDKRGLCYPMLNKQQTWSFAISQIHTIAEQSPDSLPYAKTNLPYVYVPTSDLLHCMGVSQSEGAIRTSPGGRW